VVVLGMHSAALDGQIALFGRLWYTLLTYVAFTCDCVAILSYLVPTATTNST
jgi:hypothetical protein